MANDTRITGPESPAMYRKNSADQEGGDRYGSKTWEGKIKGRGTSARASHGLHMGFGGTRVSPGVPYTASPDAIVPDVGAPAPLTPDGAY
jgi:hypothetical protein